MPEGETPQMVMKKGVLLIEGKRYQNPIIPPKPQDVLKLTIEEMDNVLQLQIAKGGRIQQGENIFLGYSVITDDIEIVSKAYMKLRLLHAEARHIVCAFNLSENPTHKLSDFCDDDEISAGRSVHKVFIDNKISHRAVFVVRYCGERLGPARFECYREATKAAIIAAPYNVLTGKRQEIQLDQDIKRAKNDRPTRPLAQMRPLKLKFGGQIRGGHRGRGFRGPRGGNVKRRLYSSNNLRRDTRNMDLDSFSDQYSLEAGAPFRFSKPLDANVWRSTNQQQHDISSGEWPRLPQTGTSWSAKSK